MAYKTVRLKEDGQLYLVPVGSNKPVEPDKPKNSGFAIGIVGLLIIVLIGLISGIGATNLSAVTNITGNTTVDVGTNTSSYPIEDFSKQQGHCNRTSDPYCLILWPGQEPSISVATLAWVLKQRQSPAAGEAASIWNEGVRAHVDPVFAEAFFHHESSDGTTGVAVVTKGPGNVICFQSSETCNCSLSNLHCFLQFKNWGDGFAQWYWQISQYINGGIFTVIPGCKKWLDAKHCATFLENVQEILWTYAPPGKDGNNTPEYIRQVQADVDWMRSLHIASNGQTVFQVAMNTNTNAVWRRKSPPAFFLA